MALARRAICLVAGEGYEIDQNKCSKKNIMQKSGALSLGTIRPD
jgi:hypothetical protein